jgi:hypothetical protein
MELIHKLSAKPRAPQLVLVSSLAGTERNMAETPKVFISYSWSTPEHEAWVLDLATRLVESGVDVVLDKWELREGQDKYKFMERMVADPEIKKVVLISDRVYAEKADQRRGGVGTESQIISAEVYEKADQQKFVPVVTELGEDGRPHLPTYMKGRVHIDMSNAANRYEKFEQLVRWIFDRPLYQKPQVGKPPSYVVEPDALQLGTTARFRAAVDAIREDRRTSVAAIRDYFDTFTSNLESLRIQRSNDIPLDDAIVASVEAFRPYRDEVVDLIVTIARHRSDPEPYDAIHAFFEQLLQYKYPPPGVTSWHDEQADNFRFILNELFLHAVAALLKYRRFEQVRSLLEQRYYIPEGTGRHSEAQLEPFGAFRAHIRSLDETRNTRLNLRRLSVKAEMSKQRATRNDIRFEDLMQADFVLLLYSTLHHPSHPWFPDTLIYLREDRPVELFARAASARFFEHLKVLLNVDSKQQLIDRFKKGSAGIDYAHVWHGDGFDPFAMMNAEKLATEP